MSISNYVFSLTFCQSYNITNNFLKTQPLRHSASCSFALCLDRLTSPNYLLSTTLSCRQQYY